MLNLTDKSNKFKNSYSKIDTEFREFDNGRVQPEYGN